MTMLTSVQLAERWALHPGTLAHWRTQGEGPPYKKVGRRILYDLKDVELYERVSTIKPKVAASPAGVAARRRARRLPAS